MALTDEQVNRAYRLFYGEGKALGEIVADLRCGIYDLSPWLTAPGMRIASDAAAAHKSHADYLFEQNQRLHTDLTEAKRLLRRRTNRDAILPQDGPPTEPGHYVVSYYGKPNTVVRVEGEGRLFIRVGDSNRTYVDESDGIEYVARILTERVRVK